MKKYTLEEIQKVYSYCGLDSDNNKAVYIKKIPNILNSSYKFGFKINEFENTDDKNHEEIKIFKGRLK